MLRVDDVETGYRLKTQLSPVTWEGGSGTGLPLLTEMHTDLSVTVKPPTGKASVLRGVPGSHRKITSIFKCFHKLQDYSSQVKREVSTCPVTRVSATGERQACYDYEERDPQASSCWHFWLYENML